MISYYIQAGHRCWLVMRDGQPTAKFTSAKLALNMAEMLATRSLRHGEEAVFSGIATEPLTPEARAA
ncbi:MAG: hypothetical protein WBW92_11660 [Rhodanobacteraceae bacterium]